MGRQAEAPRYDLSLVAARMLEADKAEASLGREEALRGRSWQERLPLAGSTGIIFWGSLAAVVAGLCVVIARLLPRTTPPAD